MIHGSLLIILDRFRWVYCQLDTLRRCMPSSIRRALNELPITLDDTYERMLQGIPKEKFEHASRLFQCMVAAIRPLRVEELAELFAIEFGSNDAPNLVESWRPENAKEAVLSTCSTFIAIVDDDNKGNKNDDDSDDKGGDEKGSRTVQFSHFSVKEFLTSDRLQFSEVGNIRQYYIPLEPAHAILARACVAVLMQADEEQDEKRFRALPLGSYAIDYWVRHARFGDVASQIEDSLAYLFNPKMPFFKPRILVVYFEDRAQADFNNFEFYEPDKVTPLFLAAACGFNGLVKHLIIVHAPDVNAEGGSRFSPLHVASRNGQVDSARVLLDSGAHVDARNSFGCTSLHEASWFGHLKLAQLLLERGADLNARADFQSTPVRMASNQGHLETVRFLLDHGADVNLRAIDGLTPYDVATQNGHHGVAQLLLEHGAERE